MTGCDGVLRVGSGFDGMFWAVTGFVRLCTVVFGLGHTWYGAYGRLSMRSNGERVVLDACGGLRRAVLMMCT